jgi:hypothetical protein
MKRGHHKHKYTTPKKGTKTRQLLLMLLRLQGATMHELRAELGWGKGSIRTNISMLGDFGGWDVRQFPVDNPNRIEGMPTSTGGWRKLTAYRIVGRDRWGGGYRSIGVDASSLVR